MPVVKGRSWNIAFDNLRAQQERRVNGSREFRQIEIQVRAQILDVCIRIRGKRNVRMLPAAWHDLGRQLQRKWKRQRRTQYKAKFTGG